MAKKKAREPQPPDPTEIFIEPEEAVSVPREREEQPRAVADLTQDGDTSDIFGSLLGIPPKEPGSVADPPPDSLGDGPEPTQSPSVDAFIRSKVLRDMYGTDNPSEYDKISLAIKKLL